MVKFRFDNNVIRFFYSFDKGVSRIDLNAINQCRSASSIKLYIIMNCWGAKGFTICKTAHIQQLMHGREDYYKTWSALDNKCLTLPAKTSSAFTRTTSSTSILPISLSFWRRVKREASPARTHHLYPARPSHFWRNCGGCRSEQRTERTAEQTETPAAIQL